MINIAAKSKTEISRFIFNLHRIEKLIEMGERAKLSGNISVLTRIGLSLCERLRRSDLCGAGKLYLGYAFNASKATDRARGMFEQALDNPLLLDSAQLALGEIELQNGNYEKATALFSAVIHNPDSSISNIYSAIHNLALIQSLEGNFTAALDTLATALSLRSKVHPLLVAESLNSAACNLNDLGKSDEARKIIDSVLSSPLVQVNPLRSASWHNTHREIEEKSQEQSKPRIFVPSVLRFPENEDSRKVKARDEIYDVIWPETDVRTATQLERCAGAVKRICERR